MDAQLRKLVDLDIDETYWVHGYNAVHTKFGDTYVLRCGYDSSNLKVFEMFATKLIALYISEKKPTHKFLFTVKKNSKYTYAEIPGYYPNKDTWTHLN